MSRGQVFLGYFVWGDKIRGGQKILLHRYLTGFLTQDLGMPVSQFFDPVFLVARKFCRGDIDSIARTWIGNAIEIVFAILVTVT